MKKFYALLLTVIALTFANFAPAYAALEDYSTADGWTLSIGEIDDAAVCMLGTTNAQDTQGVFFKYLSNAKEILVVQLIDTSWSISKNFKGTVHLTLGSYTPWSTTVLPIPGTTIGVEFFIGIDSIGEFTEELVNSSNFKIEFVDSPIGDWTGSLTGVHSLYNDFTQCISLVESYF